MGATPISGSILSSRRPTGRSRHLEKVYSVGSNPIVKDQFVGVWTEGKLAEPYDLGSYAERLAGSMPVTGTMRRWRNW